jgi:hypothetical protein
MRKLSMLFVIALILLLAAAPAAASSPPLDVNFEVDTTIGEDGTSFGPFSATGPAVDAGLVCATGDTVDVFEKASGYQSQTGVNLQVVKLFICDDGSGEFYVKLQVRIDAKDTSFNWNIIEGTGAYERLHGTGSGIGIYFPEGVLDLYEGQLHID